MAALVDTNVLVYRFDSRFPAKQKRATASFAPESRTTRYESRIRRSSNSWRRRRSRSRGTGDHAIRSQRILRERPS